MTHPGDSQPTVTFSVAEYLVVLDGPSNTIALLLAKLYGERLIPREAWSVSHFAHNRAEFIEQLRAAGSTSRRVGISVHTQETVDTVKRLAEEFKLRCATMNHH